MKQTLLALMLLSASSFAATEAETLNAYGKVAANYPALTLNYFKQGNDKVACQKAFVMNLTREAYQSRTTGPKLAKLNPWTYRNFTSSFKQLDVILNFCRTNANRAAALNAAESMAGNSFLESVGG